MSAGKTIQAEKRVWKGEMCTGLLSTKWPHRRCSLSISPNGIEISGRLGSYWLP